MSLDTDGRIEVDLLGINMMRSYFGGWLYVVELNFHARTSAMLHGGVSDTLDGVLAFTG